MSACENCRFFVLDAIEPDKTQGECRRHAPRPVFDPIQADQLADPPPREAWWPIVLIYDWCGDFSEIGQ